MYPPAIARSLCLACLMLGWAGETALARSWRLTPQGQAREYVQIYDYRGDHTVFVVWLERIGVPEIAPLVRKYSMFLVAHTEASPGGEMTAVPIPDTVEVVPPVGAPVRALINAELPPALLGMQTAVTAMFAKALGPIGKNMRVFFYPIAIDSCGKGRVSLTYAGENYTWDTPVPGCLQKDRAALPPAGRRHEASGRAPCLERAANGPCSRPLPETPRAAHLEMRARNPISIRFEGSAGLRSAP